MLLIALMLHAPPLVPCGTGVEVTRHAWAMGTELVVEVRAASGEVAAAASEAILVEVERYDALLSTWAPTTPLSALNRADAGRPLELPAEVLELLAETAEWTRRTGRAFDPTIGAIVDAWDLRGSGRVPTADELAVARGAAGPGAFSVDRRRGVAIRHREGVWIDSGAFGKGAALRAVASVLQHFDVAAATVNLGGQVLIHGPGCPRRISVADPGGGPGRIFEMEVVASSVATSGHSERPGHLLDPRSGQRTPAWGSVTIIDRDPLAADVLATALYVMGPDAGITWATEADVAALFVVDREDGRATTWSPALERFRAGTAQSEAVPTSYQER